MYEARIKTKLFTMRMTEDELAELAVLAKVRNETVPGAGYGIRWRYTASDFVRELIADERKRQKDAAKPARAPSRQNAGKTSRRRSSSSRV